MTSCRIEFPWSSHERRSRRIGRRYWILLEKMECLRRLLAAYEGAWTMQSCDTHPVFPRLHRMSDDRRSIRHSPSIYWCPVLYWQECLLSAYGIWLHRTPYIAIFRYRPWSYRIGCFPYFRSVDKPSQAHPYVSSWVPSEESSSVPQSFWRVHRHPSTIGRSWSHLWRIHSWLLTL